MNDHNLDDLIIVDAEPNNSKMKSFLTIVALFILILVVGIILTRALLENPNPADEHLVLNSTEMIAPELKLQESTEVPEPKNDLSLIESTKIQNTTLPTVKPETEKNTSTNIPTKEDKPKPIVEAKLPKKPKLITQPVQSESPEQHYIQVGSFTKDPSTRFLSVIKNSGFAYKITDLTLDGSKKLLIGPYANRAAADKALTQIRDRINKSAFIVKK